MYCQNHNIMFGIFSKLSHQNHCIFNIDTTSKIEISDDKYII